MVTADVDVKVKVPPVISEDVQPTKRVVAGETAELSCEASGFNVLKDFYLSRVSHELKGMNLS